MTSSTSPSNSASRGAMTALMGALFLSYLAAVIYTMWINPEVRFWKAAYERKITWAHTLTAKAKPKLVFIGGSSTAFQVDAGMLTQAGIPSVNMGMHAGMGSRATAAFGLSAVAHGDTVIWAFERDRLSKAPELDSLGYQALVATGVIFGYGPERQALQDINIVNVLNALRPGLDHCTVMLAKVALRHPLYRYKENFIRPGGAITTAEIRPMPHIPIKPTLPDSTTIAWISEMNAELAAIGCQTAYLIPQSYVPFEAAQDGLVANYLFLKVLGRIITVLPDPIMGVQTNLQCFADTPSHLRVEFMEKRTRDLMPLLTRLQNTQTHSR